MLEVYMADAGITPKNPFETLDRKGVGECIIGMFICLAQFDHRSDEYHAAGAFINLAVRLYRKNEPRETPSTPMGVCGNHTGEETES